VNVPAAARPFASGSPGAAPRLSACFSVPSPGREDRYERIGNTWDFDEICGEFMAEGFDQAMAAVCDGNIEPIQVGSVG
jgi:hypothetical protein